MTTGKPEPLAFQAEVARILQLMVHSVYTEKEIFLRELISNASDALDKLRYLALTDAALATGGQPAIRLEPDILTRTLTVRDNGVGMNRQELIDNLGTIARSGTRAFLETVTEKGGSTDLIGQFGVGFYASFMVAERVEVRSRKAGTSDVHVWESDGLGGFTVAAAGDDAALLGDGPGTAVTLYLKDDALAFLEAGELERVVRAYSDHILFPVLLAGEGEARQLNRASALWARPKQELSPADYAEFYRHTAHAFDEPALTIHYRAEGRSEYSVLLFVPKTRPFDLYDPSRKGRVRLYVRRVFITDDADLLPGYLRFVKGVVDSHDMPLNISREMLQNNPLVAAIRKAVTNRVLSELRMLAEREADSYGKVWQAFGAVLKEGLYEDPERRDALYELARFRTTTAGESWRSLEDTVAAFKPNQTAIYYLAGESLDKLKASPQLEGYAARGVEVLLLTDPVDNFWVTTALGYDGKPFQSVSQGDAGLGNIPTISEVPRSSLASRPETVRLIEDLRTALGDTVSEVRVSSRLVGSAACLVAPAGGPDRNLEKILAKQAYKDGGFAGVKPILEINPEHGLVRLLEAETGTGGERFQDLAWVLFEQARLLEGDAPADPGKFAERLNRLLVAAASAGP